jgi:hypothetical protein
MGPLNCRHIVLGLLFCCTSDNGGAHSPLTLAHLALCAATILARPSGLILLRRGLAVCGADPEAVGLLGFASVV